MAPELESILKNLTNRKGLKILALTLAAATWYYIRESTSFEEIFNDIPLEVQLPDGWAIQDRSVNTVEVMVRGSQSDIRALNESQIRVQIAARAGDDNPNPVVKIDRSNVSLPRSVRAIYVDPSEVSLNLDRETDKQVPVRVEQLGQPPEGFDIEKIVITPPMVTLHGPERRLASVEYVRTVPIDMEGRIRSFQLNRALMSPGENWQARMDIDKVRVEFTIVERATMQNFTNVSLKALMPPGGSFNVSFSPSIVNVALKGRIDVISNLSARAVHAYVDCTDLKPGVTESILVEVPIPSGVNIMAIEPPSVRVTIREIEK
jgi:YbbR domain-containing protein